MRSGQMIQIQMDSDPDPDERIVSRKRGNDRPVALARASPASPAGPLAGRGLGDGGDHQAVHANLAVVHLLLGKAWVHHIVDAINGQGGLSNVGGDDNLAGARRCRLKNAGLHSIQTIPWSPNKTLLAACIKLAAKGQHGDH